MNKDQYFNQHRLQQIERQELERKWRIFNEQRMLMNMALSNTASSGGGGAGGPAVSPNPKAIKIAAKNVTFGYDDETTGNLAFFNADWDAVLFSDNADTGIPYADITGWQFDEMIDGKGLLIRITMNIGDRYYLFIDAGCNIIETVHLVDDSTYGRSANRTTCEGLVIQLSYRNELGRVIKWWNGDEIFTYIDTSINSSSNNFSLGWYSQDNAFSDGTTSAYINDLDLGNRVFHCRPDGQFLEVTSTLKINETFAQDSLLYCVGNFAISYFIPSTPSLNGIVDYNSESFEITLRDPVPGLRIGMAITGPDFTEATLINNIDGLTITVTKLPTTTENEIAVEFIGNFVDTFRVSLSDGTYTDLNVSGLNASNVEDKGLFGSDKAFFILHRYFDNTAVYIIYNHSTGSLIGTSPTDYFVNYTYYNARKKNFFYAVESINGCERFLGAQLGDSSWDGKMSRYNDFTFIWTNSAGEPFTYTFDTTAGTLGINYSNGYGSPMYAVINSPESLDLEIIRFNDNGTVDITSLETTYSDWNGVMQYGALGDKTFVRYEDNSRISLDNKTQANAVFAGGTSPADQIWVNNDNNVVAIGETYFISQTDEDVTYLFNYALNEFYETGDALSTWYLFRETSYQNAINFETLSNAALLYPDSSFMLVNPTYTPPPTLNDGAGLEFKGSSDYAVKLSEDSGADGFVRIDVYNYEGTLVNFVITQATGYNDFQVVNERIYLAQNPIGDIWHFYIITPNEDEYSFKEITIPGGPQTFINSYGWWD